MPILAGCDSFCGRGRQWGSKCLFLVSRKSRRVRATWVGQRQRQASQEACPGGRRRQGGHARLGGCGIVYHVYHGWLPGGLRPPLGYTTGLAEIPQHALMMVQAGPHTRGKGLSHARHRPPSRNRRAAARSQCRTWAPLQAPPRPPLEPAGQSAQAPGAHNDGASEWGFVRQRAAGLHADGRLKWQFAPPLLPACASGKVASHGASKGCVHAACLVLGPAGPAAGSSSSAPGTPSCAL